MKCPFCLYEDESTEWDVRFCGCEPACGNGCERDEDVSECPDCLTRYDKE